jgi:hypothetical protein
LLPFYFRSPVRKIEETSKRLHDDFGLRPTGLVMKEIPTTFRKHGFDFNLLLREADIALFRKTKPGLKFESFEVVIIQRHEAFSV